ncbi:MAG: response regulator [Spirochaetaceae bacterium]|nr:response regulator [Spirochaetaceae bacterium]
MAINREKYIDKYVDEGLDNTALIETLVFDIKDGNSLEDDLATLLRALHTLKGSSRMLEFVRIEELSHALESVFVAIKEHRVSPSDSAIKLILASLDLLKSGFAVIRQEKDDAIEIGEYVKNLVFLAANEEFTLPAVNEEQVKYTLQKKSMDQSPEEKVVRGEPDTLTAEPSAPSSPAGSASGDVRSVPPPLSKPQKEAKSESIRIPIEKIDDIIKSIASLQFLEIASKSISMEYIALSSMIKEYSKILKEDKKHDPALVTSFVKLERLSERINSTMKNYNIDAGSQIKSAYDRVISLRTLPLSTILDSYPRYVYQLSGELGKKVQLTIEGKENEIDKNIIETLAEMFMHMVRNSIDHGIETPEERLAAGKSETAQLLITCLQESGNMRVVISDDGRGIDPERIREKAIRGGFVTEAAAASLTKEALIHFIFQSGFSTSKNLSNVSGRGVGLDVVRDSVEALKGSIVVESNVGSGTAFTIAVPLSIAALMGFPIVCGEMKFIIPSNFVDTILLINQSDIVTVVDRPEIKYSGRMIKLYYLSQILRIKAESVSMRDAVFVVIIRSYDDIMALAVDDISSMRSVILKNMPKFMETIPVFSGIVLNEDYELVSVLHIPAIIKMAKRIKSIDMKKRNVEFEKLRKTILVVDDSLATREIESDILTAEGYLVDTAADGAEALRAAKSKNYDLICTDINMPIMDGFMLTENIKKNNELSHIPVIVISSRASEEDQKQAAMLGASRYIIKNSFNNHNLLEAVRELLGGDQ